jgi:RHS repeat-associated protein
MRRFYCAGQLTTESDGDRHHSYLQAGGRLIAQRDATAKGVHSSLLATDNANSVLAAGSNPSTLVAYSPYGHREIPALLPVVPGFNGEQPDPLTGHYPLGNGYRSYNPVLMRFNSPDNLSPFDEGEINGYAYCTGDPVNRGDSTGHLSSPHLLRMAIKPVISLRVGLQKMGALPGKVLTVEGHVFDIGQSAPWNILPRAPKPILNEMPPHVQNKILNYMAWNEPSTMAQVSKAMHRRVMADSAAQFKRLEIAGLPYQGWLRKLDQIGFNEVPGIAPGYLRSQGLTHEPIRQELIRAPRRIRGQLIRYGESPEALAALDAAQLQAMNGAGW